jgi:small subunit ribosomal protein S17
VGGKRKIRVGKVVSASMDQTVVVGIESHFRHPFYKKIVKRTKKFKVHDQENKCRVGDEVSIMETRPLSKTKRWRVMEIIKRTE